VARAGRARGPGATPRFYSGAAHSCGMGTGGRRQGAAGRAAGAPGAPHSSGGGEPGPRVDMPEPPARSASGRQGALDRVMYALAKEKKLSGAIGSHLDRMRPDSPLAMWDGLFFELHHLNEPKLASKIADVCKEIRTNAWRGIVDDDGLLSHLGPMLSQFTYSSDDAAESLRFKIASMSNTVRASFVPGEKVRALVVNMAKFGSLQDYRMIRAIVEELYVRRDNLWGACGICEDILRFSGRDKSRMMASTLVEDMVGDVLAELQRIKSRDYAFSVDRGIFPLLASPADPSHGRLLERLVMLLVRRASSLGLAVPRDPSGSARLFWASALAHRVSAHTRRFRPEEIVRHAKLRHERAFGFLGLGHVMAVSRLHSRGHALVENASSAIALQMLAGVRAPLPLEQDALGLLDSLLGHMGSLGIDAGPEAEKKWRAGMLGPRLWGSLLEMEALLRLRAANVGVRPAPGGHGVALELDGLRVEAHSPLDGLPPEQDRAERDGSHEDPVDMLGRAGHAGEARRTMVIVDCTVGAPVGLEALAGVLSPGFAPDGQPGALCLVRREHDSHEHLLVKNPHIAEILDSATDPVRRALGVDIAGSGATAP